MPAPQSWTVRHSHRSQASRARARSGSVRGGAHVLLTTGHNAGLSERPGTIAVTGRRRTNAGRRCLLGARDAVRRSLPSSFAGRRRRCLLGARDAVRRCLPSAFAERRRQCLLGARDAVRRSLPEAFAERRRRSLPERAREAVRRRPAHHRAAPTVVGACPGDCRGPMTSGAGLVARARQGSCDVEDSSVAASVRRRIMRA
jgi:hypothetical protein